MRQNHAHSNGHGRNAVESNGLSSGKKHPKTNGVTELKPNQQLKRNKCDLGPNFVAPNFDGGFGWLVLIAAGCSNLFTFPMLQQFGLVFKERLESIGLSSTEITTIINLNPCMTSCSGLLNGPMFRRFTYRQVAFFGVSLIVISLYLTSISNSLTTYLITFGILYGLGTGINSSANSLALNTYFKEKRRIATGIAWTCTGLGPILFPHFIAIIMPLYGIDGCILIFTGIALNAIVCACIFQPVQWHVKKPSPKEHTVEENLMQLPSLPKCDFCQMAKKRGPNIMSGEYLYNADNESATGYEIIDPGIPMLALANDGMSSRRSMYGSRSSLYSNRASRIGSRKPSSQNLVGLNRSRSSSVNMVVMAKERKRKMSENAKIVEHPEDVGSNPNVQRDVQSNGIKSTPKTPDIRIADVPDIKYFINEAQPALSIGTLEPRRKISTANNFNVEKELRNVSEKLEAFITKENRPPTITNFEEFCTCDEKMRLHLDPTLSNEHDNEVIEEEKIYQTMSCIRRGFHHVVVFFDLDLLRDITYVNLMLGVTLGNFAELNFSLLTPFFLADWGFEKRQIANVMSLLAGIDVSIRFFVPFVASKIGWDNRTFFLVGIFSMAMGRVFITFYRSYAAIVAAFCWIGVGKGLRTVFMALVIPSYVPLHRLPAASGLQLVFAGIFYFLAGPLVGYVRDKTDYVTTLHFLNLATYFVTICWISERIYLHYQEKNRKRIEPESPIPSVQ